MKRFLILLFVSFFAFSCSQNEREQDKIQETINGFYKSLNKRDFEKMETFLSVRMKQKMAYFRNVAEEMVVYESYKVKNVVVNGNVAMVEVECVDMFDNKIFCEWNLVKINDDWKLDVEIL